MLDGRYLRNVSWSMVALEIGCIVVLLLTNVFIANELQSFVFRENGVVRVVQIVFSAVLLLSGYVVIRLFFSAILAACLAIAANFTVSLIHYQKFALTNEPLSWTDLTAFSNYSIVLHYIQPIHVCLGIAVSCGLLLVVMFSFRTRGVSRARIQGLVVRSAAVALLSITPLGVMAGNLASTTLSNIFESSGMPYLFWDWPKNFVQNGLLVHLAQTSERNIPMRATAQEALDYQKLDQKTESAVRRPRTVITILCESCWSDGNHFANAFAPLTAKGFKSFRAISPVYGGGTVNAEFEVQTGLPSNGSTLTGVIYQEYAPLMKRDVDTISQRLRKAGYYTVAMHNNARSFYQRDEVYPKFGFDDFYSIEHMELNGGDPWPADDAILYKKAIEVLSAHKNSPVYMKLVTVHTHGTYVPNADHGEGDYERRLNYSIKQMAEFIGKVTEIDPDTLILVYGDHKPALNKFFFDQGVLGSANFLTTGPDDLDFRMSPTFRRDVVGDVPAFVLSSSAASIEKFVGKAQGLPFYCMSQLFSDVFLSLQTAAHHFARNTCRDYSSVGYDKSASSFPAWLFSLAVLDQELLD